MSGLAEFRQLDGWRGRQRCGASQPVPDKYAFQAADKQTDEHSNRRTSPSRFCGGELKITVRNTRNLHHHGLAVWLSDNALASINVVALRQTRLVSGWVTVCGRVNHLGM